MERVKEKKQFVCKLKKRVKIAEIMSVGMTCLPDNYVVLNIQNDEAYFGSINSKTEFLAILNDQYKSIMNREIDRAFSNTLTYQCNVKGGKKQVQANQDKTNKMETAVLTSSSSKWTITVADDLPASYVLPTSILYSKPAAQKSNNSNTTKRSTVGLQSTVLPPAPTEQSPVYVKCMIHVYSYKQLVPDHQKEETKQATPVAATATRALPERPTKPDTRKKMRAIYAHDAMEADELSIKENDTIIVVREDPSGQG